MQMSTLFLLALATGATAGVCPASVGSGALLSACGTNSCGATMQVPLGAPFALCDPCQGPVGMQALIELNGEGTFLLTPTGLGTTEMKEGECVSGLKLERDGAYGRGAVELQAAGDNVTWTVEPTVVDECTATCASCEQGTCSAAGQECNDADTSPASLGDWTCDCYSPTTGSAVAAAAVCVGVPTSAPIPTPVGSFEKARFCKNANKCTKKGDDAATCDTATGDCACSTGFDGKLCKPVDQPEEKVKTALVTTFKDAKCTTLKNSPVQISQCLAIIEQASGEPVEGYTIQCGTEAETVQTAQGRDVQALETMGAVFATFQKILPSKVDEVTSGMAAEVAEAVAAEPALQEVVGASVDGRATLVETDPEEATCAIEHATVQILQTVNGVQACTALQCETGYAKQQQTESSPTTCEVVTPAPQPNVVTPQPTVVTSQPNVVPSTPAPGFICVKDSDCTFDVLRPMCGADGQCAVRPRELVDAGLSTGVIVALALGATVLFFVIVGAVVMLMTKKGGKVDEAHHPENEEVTATPVNEPVSEQIV